MTSCLASVAGAQAFPWYLDESYVRVATLQIVIDRQRVITVAVGRASCPALKAGRIERDALGGGAGYHFPVAAPNDELFAVREAFRTAA